MSRKFIGARRFGAGAVRRPARHRRPSDADLAEIREQIRQLKESYEARHSGRSSAAARTPRARSGPARRQRRASAPLRRRHASSSSRSCRVQPGDLGGASGTLRQPVAGSRKFAIAALPPGGEIGPGQRGFSLSESELAISANVDHLFAGNLIVSLTPENTVSVEEAYGIYTAAPYGLVAEVRPLLFGPRLHERAAPARVGLHRCAARVPGVPRRAVRATTACR